MPMPPAASIPKGDDSALKRRTSSKATTAARKTAKKLPATKTKTTARKPAKKVTTVTVKPAKRVTKKTTSPAPPAPTRRAALPATRKIKTAAEIRAAHTKAKADVVDLYTQAGQYAKAIEDETDPGVRQDIIDDTPDEYKALLPKYFVKVGDTWNAAGAPAPAVPPAGTAVLPVTPAAPVAGMGEVILEGGGFKFCKTNGNHVMIWEEKNGTYESTGDTFDDVEQMNEYMKFARTVPVAAKQRISGGHANPSWKRHLANLGKKKGS